MSKSETLIEVTIRTGDVKIKKHAALGFTITKTEDEIEAIASALVANTVGELMR